MSGLNRVAWLCAVGCLMTMVLVGCAGTAATPAPEPTAVPPVATEAAPVNAPSVTAPTLADPVAEGRALAEAYFTALQSGVPQQVAKVLASEARIARANGDVVARDDYLTKLPVIKSFSLDNVDAVQRGDSLVVTYHVLTDEVINGVQQPTKDAPRMTVFQWQDGQWKLLAHANFNAIQGPTPTP
jgi:hypothetical protein